MRNLQHLLLAAAMAGCFSAAASNAQPAHGPSPFEWVDSAGKKQAFHTSYVDDISILPDGIVLDVDKMSRSALRLFCIDTCPADIPAKRSKQDVITWRDGRQTTGYVALYEKIIEQDGKRAGRLEDVKTIELGTARPNAKLVSSFKPGQIDLSNGAKYGKWEGGTYIVFREPWIELKGPSLTLQGRPPRERSGIRFISHGNGGGGHVNDPRPSADMVYWKNGPPTSGTITIEKGMVFQPGHPPKPFKDVQYIDLAPWPAG